LNDPKESPYRQRWRAGKTAITDKNANRLFVTGEQCEIRQ
jgi:hypothetical protein